VSLTHYSTHNGQQGYNFLGELNEIGLPKYACVICGSGDYILSAKPPIPVDLEYYSEITVAPTPPSTVVTPEASTWILVFFPLLLIGLLRFKAKKPPKRDTDISGNNPYL
jgi:hypothetical protein